MSRILEFPSGIAMGHSRASLQPRRPRVLVAYYSRTGLTKRVAEQLAHDLEADLEVIVDHTPRIGVLGYLRSNFDGMLHHSADIAASTHDPSDYDLVLVGSPVWNRSICIPTRAYLQRHVRDLPSVGFFCTHAGSGVHHAMEHMAELCGKHPVWTLAVGQSELKQGSELDTITAATRRLGTHAPASTVA